jgi:SAM-dependent methyltransferase
MDGRMGLTVKRLRHRAATLGGRTPAANEVWASGVDDEIAFWRDWLRTGGAEWPQDYEDRMDPRRPLDPVLAANLPPRTADGSGGTDRVTILDVGAGPLTCVGRVVEGREVDVVAVDALADAYDELLDEVGVVPPVRTVRCETERLTERFAAATFDLAHARNTLDHSYDPVLAIRQMAEVTRPGGVVVLQHYDKEAENEGYAGLHQWNLSVERGRPVVSRPVGLHTDRHDVATELADLVELVTATPGSRTQLDQVVLRRR